LKAVLAILRLSRLFLPSHRDVPTTSPRVSYRYTATARTFHEHEERRDLRGATWSIANSANRLPELHLLFSSPVAHPFLHSCQKFRMVSRQTIIRQSSHGSSPIFVPKPRIVPICLHVHQFLQSKFHPSELVILLFRWHAKQPPKIASVEAIELVQLFHQSCRVLRAACKSWHAS
jgi:hypothetical protein